MQKRALISASTKVDHPPPHHPFPVSLTHKKIRLIESNAKCRYLKKLTYKGTLRQVFYLSEAPSPPTRFLAPLDCYKIPAQYTYSHREGGRANQREG
jgi:hypothetical protein